MLVMAMVLSQATSAGTTAQASDDLIRLLQSKAKACQQCQLNDVDLIYSDLRDANLRGASLQRANLSKVNLDGADLSESILSFSSLQGASLRGTDLRGSRLYGTDLRNADQVVPNWIQAHSNKVIGKEPKASTPVYAAMLLFTTRGWRRHMLNDGRRRKFYSLKRSKANQRNL